MARWYVDYSQGVAGPFEDAQDAYVWIEDNLEESEDPEVYCGDDGAFGAEYPGGPVTFHHT